MYRLHNDLVHHDNIPMNASVGQPHDKPSTSNRSPFDLGLESEAPNQDPQIDYDPNRRSSLGAESLMEHDMNEDTGNLDDCIDFMYSEAHVGLEYADEIFMLHKSNEHIRHPRNYIEKQPQITEYMRCTLINWLVKVNHELKFGAETIYIAVNLTDRFLEATPIAQDCLQLLAICALFVAAKLEETVVPGISALVNLCGSTYRRHHFKGMENLLLSTLRFRLYSPTSWFFVTYITLKSCHTISPDKRIINLARYTIETCLGNYRISQYLPSEQAAAALTFSCLVIYSSNSVYSLSNEDSASCNTYSNYEDYQIENHFELLSSLSGFSSSLLLTLKEIFSSEEWKNISSCFELMKAYMKPFLQSTDSAPSFLNANVSYAKKEYTTPQNVKNIYKPAEICGTIRSVYNEDKEAFERVEIYESYASTSKYSPYDVSYGRIRRNERYKISREKYSTVDVHMPAMETRDIRNQSVSAGSLYGMELKNKASRSIMSDWNVT